jgi:hypothetical protein
MRKLAGHYGADVRNTETARLLQQEQVRIAKQSANSIHPVLAALVIVGFTLFIFLYVLP